MYDHIMYTKLQQQAKEYIIGRLNNNSDNLRFDIDTTDPDTTIMICHSPSESVKIIVENMPTPEYILNCICSVLHEDRKVIREWEYIYVVRLFIKDVFKIYGFQICQSTIFDYQYNVIDVQNNLFGNYNWVTTCVDKLNPFIYEDIRSELFFEKLGNRCPLLILLNPIRYFHCCSLIIKEHNLRMNHTDGTYELFLSCFPEKNDSLFRDYLMAYTIFHPYCQDICSLILEKLIDLLQLSS